MGFKRKTSKRSIPVIVVAVVIVAACTTTFLAFAISRNRSVIENQVTVANNGVRILEDSVAGFGKHEISFKNEGAGSSKVLLRIAYSETWSKTDGTIVSNVGASGNAVTKSWTDAFTQDFVDGNDGWYYYTKTLNPEAEVKVLNSIALNDDSYSVYNYDLSFRFESVQADATAANTLWGKTVTIDNNGAATWAF